MSSRLRFGTFLAPHHPLGENPTLLFQRDLQLVEHLDALGFDEFWCGEHHSSGWETIASPEMFLAAAAQRSHRIMLGTGVVSLPYHHPFNVAQRIVQLDHMTRGRAMLGTGPGALASDAYMLGIDPMTQRDRQDEAVGVILRLLRGEVVDHECEWFTLRQGRLQLLPVQDNMQVVTASTISPSGMQIAGKYGLGVLSIASNTQEGIQALPTQWGFAEEAAARHGTAVDRGNWRVMMSWHIAETREEARKQALHGLHRWHNEYIHTILGRPGSVYHGNPWELMDSVAGDGTDGSSGSGAAVIGTPDDLVRAIRSLQNTSGGFGVLLGFAHDWAGREDTLRSWDLVARYVIPELVGSTTALKESARWLIEKQSDLVAGASAAVMAKIQAHAGATEAMKTTMEQAAQLRAKKDAAFRPGPGLPNVD